MNNPIPNSQLPSAAQSRWSLPQRLAALCGALKCLLPLPARRVLSCLATSAVLGLLAVGCGTYTNKDAGDFAAVTISGQSADAIALATAKVFGAEGYMGGASGPGRMTFEKAASRGTSIAREGIVGAYYGAQTVNRVRVEIIPLLDGTHRLQCKAYMVTGGSDPFFQEEVPVAHVRSGPYRSLLDKVAQQLK